MEEDSLMRSECPDCQLQILQHQQGQATTETSSSVLPNGTDQYGNEERRLAVQVNSELSSCHGQSQAEVSPAQFPHGEAYQVSHSVGVSQSRMALSSSTQCQNLFGSYTTKDLSFNTNGSSSNSIPISSSNEIPSGTLPVSSNNGCYEGAQNIAANNSSSTTTGEPICDNYYCSTCSVYDIPNSANEKFYRTSSSRPPAHVFPPIFYSQGPSSVIPCFSPIPDCTPWGNEYASYAYASASYSQSSTATSSTDYYGYSVPSTSASTGNYEMTMTSSTTNYIPSVSYSSLPNPYCNTTCAITNEQLSSTESGATAVPATAEGLRIESVGVETKKKTTNNNGSRNDQDSVSIEISSTSSLDDSFNSSDDSQIDDGSSLSDERELISVVEDDEDQIADNLRQVTNAILDGRSNPSDSNQKCLICSGSTNSLPECTSPQLARILEHIDEDITTEDLDISVSSVDIEIGGIEDEMKAFTSLRKKSNLKYDITFDRVQQLLGKEKLKVRLHTRDTYDIVPLCCRCHKLVCLVDSYQKQMTSLLGALNQLISEGDSLVHSKDSNPSTVTPIKTGLERIVEKKCVETQTDDIDWVGFDYKATSKETSNPMVDLSDQIDVTVPFVSTTTSSSVNELIGKDCSFDMHIPEAPDGKLKELICFCRSISNRRLLDSNTLMEFLGSNIQAQRIVTPPSVFIQQVEYQDDGIPEQSTNHEKSSQSQFKKHEDQLGVDKRKVINNECEYCKRNFTTKSYLKSHTEICKFKLTHETQADSISRDKTNGMRCSKCGIGFRNILRWTKHTEQGCQRTIYQCSDCPQRFNKNSELKVHIKAHVKEKSYKCDTCSLAFTTKGNLIAHSRIHSNTKKFECTFCHKGFNRRFALTMHENRHKGR